MINLRDRDEIWPSIVTVSAVVVLAGTLVLMLLPSPTTAGLKKIADRQKLNIRIKTKQAQERMIEAQNQIAASTWSGTAESVGTDALRRITTIAAARNAKLGAFRPQRAATADDLNTLPFSITVEGSYPNILAFARDIEGGANRLAVSLVQISSADPSTDRVTANIGIVAYLTPKPPATLADANKRGSAHA